MPAHKKWTAEHPKPKVKRHRTEYYKQYNRAHRPHICTIRGTISDFEVLVPAQQNSGFTWLKIAYRGLGIKRPKQIPAKDRITLN